MYRLLKRYRRPILVVFLVLLPLAVYRAHVIRPRDATVLDRLVWLVTQPVRSGLSNAVDSMSWAWTSLRDLSSARIELGRARVRLRRLDDALDRLEAAEAENRALRVLLELGQQGPYALPVAARVIGGGFGPQARTVDIDRGAIHDIRRGFPVLRSEGLVGLVQRVGWTSSEVALLADERVTVLAMVARNRVQGRVHGGGVGQSYVMEDVSRDAEVSTGDLVVTSGLGGVFPPNVPIGRVSEVVVEPRSLRMILDPASDTSRLDWVSVVPRPPRPEPGATPMLLRPPELWSESPVEDPAN